MPLEERIARWKSLMAGIESSNVKVWRDSFVETLRACAAPGLPFQIATDKATPSAA